MSFRWLALSFVIPVSLISLLPACAQKNDQLRINEIQVIGTHNSYHAGFAPSAEALWKARNPAL